MNYDTAIIGGGCFWCIEAIMQQLVGVKKVSSGYAGGNVPGKPTYREVCSGLTGHAEVVQVTFDPSEISYHDLLIVFMTSHNPSKGGASVANPKYQYRSVIFYHSDDQKSIAENVLKKISELHEKPAGTELSKAPEFFHAEDYHQNYFIKNPSGGYCRAFIEPKLVKLRKGHADKIATHVNI